MESKRERYRDYHTANEIIADVGIAILNGRSVTDCAEAIGFFSDNEFSEEIIVNLTSVGFNRQIYRAVTVYDRHEEATRLLAGIDKIERKKRSKFRFLSVGYTVVATVASEIYSYLITTRWIKSL